MREAALRLLLHLNLLNCIQLVLDMLIGYKLLL